MDLRDAYPDEARATKLAESLKLNGKSGELRESTRLALARRAMANGLVDQLSAGGARNE